MSKFSGKCDFADFIFNNEIDYNKFNENFSIYVGEYPFYINEEADLIPLYPHIIAVHYKNENKHFIKLTKDSFLKSNDMEVSSWLIRDILTAYKKLNKKPSVDEVSTIGYKSMIPFLLDSLPEEVFNLKLKNKNIDFISKVLSKTYYVPTPMSMYYLESLLNYAVYHNCKNKVFIEETKWVLKYFNKVRINFT